MKFVLLFVVFAACSATPDAAPRTVPALPTRSGLVPMEVEGHTVFVALAADEASRGRGLADRTTLAADEGMLFVYPAAGQRSFWMLGCRIALDIAFLDDQGGVLNVVTLPAPAPGLSSAQLPLAASLKPARFVLELPAGTFARWGLDAGARCILPALPESVR